VLPKGRHILPNITASNPTMCYVSAAVRTAGLSKCVHKKCNCVIKKDMDVCGITGIRVIVISSVYGESNSNVKVNSVRSISVNKRNV